MSEYEPGTVAVATVRGVPNVRVMRVDLHSSATGPRKGWVHASNFPSERQLHGASLSYEADVTDVHPLIVLDLDKHSDAAVADLIGQLRTSRWHRIADQIEAQTRPPKPPEPQGLGAVVEDADGVRWVNVYEEGMWQNHHDRNIWHEYDDINAVKVLSEGVTA